MPGIYPRKSKKTGKLLHYVVWWVDEFGERQREKGPREKAIAEKIAREYQAKADLRRAGLEDREQVELAEQLRRPIEEVKEEYLLLKVEVTARRVRDTRSLLTKIFKLGEIERLADLKKSAVESALAKILQEGSSPATYNRYRALARAFSRWCYESEKIRKDPLAKLKALNEEIAPTFVRRTLTTDELTRLLQATADDPGTSKPPRKVDGPTRALVYRLAIATGLRYTEIRTLKLDRLDLGERPAALLEAGNAKNKRSAWQPLPSDLAEDLRAYAAGRPANKPLFTLPRYGSRMIMKDLKLAGLPFEDEQGRRFDFHCLRSELATLADAQGVPLGISQKLMRHSTPTLTARYTRHGDEALVRAVESLPIPRPTPRADPPDSARAGAAPNAEEGKSAKPPPLEGGEQPPAKRSNRVRLPKVPTEQISLPGGDLPASPFTMSIRPDGQTMTGCDKAGHAAARAGAAPDPDLSRLIESWPALPDRIRSAIMALVEIANPKPPDG